MSGQDWTDFPEWTRWVRHIRTNVLPALQDSAVVMSIAPDGEPDIKFAVELGLSITLNKPIVLLVIPGRSVPDKLAAVADAILEADPGTQAGQATIAEFVRDRLAQLVDGKR